MATKPLTQTTGRRKEAVARARLRQGTGQVTINGRPFDIYFPTAAQQAVEWLTPLTRWRDRTSLHRAVGHDVEARGRTAVVDWVETGRAPERVVATGNSAPGESRPLCPYPAHAHYGGKGDARDASNYNCHTQ